MNRFVKDYMTRDITSVTPDMTLRDVAELLALHRLYGVPVVDDDNKVVGFISEKTLLKAVFPERIDSDSRIITLDKFQQIIKRLGNFGDTEVGSFMRRDTIKVCEDDLIADVVDIILNKDISSLPVTRSGQIVGMINRADICKFMLDSDHL